MHEGVARHEVGGDPEPVMGQFLDLHVPEHAVHHASAPIRTDQRLAGERVVTERTSLRQFVPGDLPDLVHRPPVGEQCADERPDAGPTKAIDGHARLQQRFHDPDVGQTARSTAGEHDTHRSTEDAPGRTFDTGAQRITLRQPVASLRRQAIDPVADVRRIRCPAGTERQIAPLRMFIDGTRPPGCGIDDEQHAITVS